MWQGYTRIAVELDLGPMYATDSIIRHTASSLSAPPSGRGHDNMNAYCTNFLQNFLNSRYYFIMMMIIIIIIEIVHVA